MKSSWAVICVVVWNEFLFWRLQLAKSGTDVMICVCSHTHVHVCKYVTYALDDDDDVDEVRLHL
jgi:hypothetical protein